MPIDDHTHYLRSLSHVNLPVVLANNQDHILFHTLYVLKISKSCWPTTANSTYVCSCQQPTKEKRVKTDHTGSNCTSTPSEPTPSHQRHLHQRHLHQLISLSTNAVCTNYAERTNEQTSDQAKERTSEGTNERTSERRSKRTKERTTQRTTQRMTQ
jgi:hypothetical protein